MTRWIPRIAALAVAASLAVACGKKGPLQPPLRPVPVAVSEFSAERLGQQVTLRFNVPDAHQDGTRPSRVEAVEIYAVTQPAAAPAPGPPQLTVEAYRVAVIAVRPFGQPPASAADTRPAPGDPATFVEKLPAPSTTGADTIRYYAATGRIGNRRGSVSPVLALPITAAPAPPANIQTDFTETVIRVAWTPAASGDRFIVEEVGPGATADAKRLTPQPISAAELTVPVEFGRERCFAVRSVKAGDGVMSIGAASPPGCVTPHDRFPPAPPTELVASTVEGAIDLVWTASPSSDAAGYIVLRGDGADGTLQRLTTTPTTATTYKDQAVRAGMTYSYAVVAVDAATPPNESGPSNRYVVTARRP